MSSLELDWSESSTPLDTKLPRLNHFIHSMLYSNFLVLLLVMNCPLSIPSIRIVVGTDPVKHGCSCDDRAYNRTRIVRAASWALDRYRSHPFAGGSRGKDDPKITEMLKSHRCPQKHLREVYLNARDRAIFFVSKKATETAVALQLRFCGCVQHLSPRPQNSFSICHVMQNEFEVKQ